MIESYGLKQNFDFILMDQNTDDTYTINDSNNFKIKRNYDTTYLYITKGTIDLTMLNAFMSGKYDYSNFKIIGNSIIRNSNDGMDSDLQLYVESAKFVSVEFETNYDLVANPVFKFEIKEGYQYGEQERKLFRIIGEKTW